MHFFIDFSPPYAAKHYAAGKQGMRFCKVSGGFLMGHGLKTVTVARLHECLSLCTADEHCLSVNYRSTGECTLNDDADLGNSNDFTTNMGADYIYFTFGKCNM